MKRALIFRGGWEGHEPVQTSDMVAGELRKRGMEVEIFDQQECLLVPELETEYDVIIPVWTMGTLIPEASAALRKAVLNGVGLGGWHGGMCDAFREDTEYQFMTGGQWVAHPGNVIDYRVEITGRDPIVDGIGDFDMHSEQYYMQVDPGNEVLAVTRFNGAVCPWIDGTVMPVVWKRRYGKGKVFYSSLGHVAEDFRRTPQSLEIAVRGILWAAR
ncbi:ThuA domain-containing protein [uncultured Victivallis sp.]|uniref:ThuA domain-containing protein n=1 Tax=uncultured Victivallis sp. TaxID=354118 RepID=UPI002600674E|nr:ThuA domain-containing protein [uncultured Victivallis sp.]